MPIRKRAVRQTAKTIVKVYHTKEQERIIVHQYIRDMPIRKNDDGTADALINQEWFPADAIDPEKRGGCLYEVYKAPYNSAAPQEG